MYKRSFFLTDGLALAAALAGLNTTTAPDNTTNVAARVRQLTGTVLPGGEIRHTNQEPTKPAANPASKVQLAVRSLPLIELGNPLRLPPLVERRRVKYGRHRWVVLG